jgi:hypothetical protein
MSGRQIRHQGVAGRPADALTDPVDEPRGQDHHDGPGRRGYRFTGTVTYERLLPAGASRPYVVTPAGFEPAISTLKGSRPWPG